VLLGLACTKAQHWEFPVPWRGWWMYSARWVGPITCSRTLDEVVRRAFLADRYSQPPRSGTIRSAPGCRAGFEPAVTMYSTRTVECCFMFSRRSCGQRQLLSCASTIPPPVLKGWPGGSCTHTSIAAHRILMYSKPAVGRLFGRPTKWWPETYGALLL